MNTPRNKSHAVVGNCRTLLLLGGTLALAGFSSGCASQKALQSYQDEIMSLREERTQLKKDNRGLRMQVDSYGAALAEANAKLLEEPEVMEYPELDALGVDYGTRDGNMVISIPSEVTFDSGKAKLTANGQKALRAVAETLMADFGEGHYWIEGHTDSDPIKKSKWTSNRELSLARAMAVLGFMVDDCKIGDDTCVVAGHGQYSPIGTDSSRLSKAKNRRVEIVVRNDG